MKEDLFTETEELIRFLSAEQYFLNRELGLVHFSIPRIANACDVTAGHLRRVLNGDFLSVRADTVTGIASMLMAEVELFMGDKSTAYTDEACVKAYKELNAFRQHKARDDKSLSLQSIAESMGYSKSYFHGILGDGNGRLLSVDMIAKFGKFIGIPVHVIVRHDFRHCAD